MLTCANTQEKFGIMLHESWPEHKSKYTGQRSNFSAFHSDSLFQLSNITVVIIYIANLHVHALSIIQHI